MTLAFLLSLFPVLSPTYPQILLNSLSPIFHLSFISNSPQSPTPTTFLFTILKTTFGHHCSTFWVKPYFFFCQCSSYVIILQLREPPGFQDITPSGKFFHHWWLSSSPVVLPLLQAHTTHQAWAALGSSAPLLTPSVYLSPSSVSPWTAASPQRFHHCCSPTPLGNSFLIDLPLSIFSSSLIHLPHF